MFRAELKNLMRDFFASSYMVVESAGIPEMTSMYSWSEMLTDSSNDHIMNLSGMTGSPFSFAFL